MPRLQELRWGPKAIFDWLETSIDPEDYRDGTNFAGDYTNRQAYEIALTLNIGDDKQKVESALRALEVANRLSNEQNIPLREALWLIRDAQDADPLCTGWVSLRRRATGWWKSVRARTREAVAAVFG